MGRLRSLIVCLGAGFLTWLLLVGPPRDRYSTEQNALWIELLKPDGSTVTGTPVAELWPNTYGLLDYVTFTFEKGRLLTNEGVVEVTKPWQGTARLEPGPTARTLALVSLVWAAVPLLLSQRCLRPTSSAADSGGEGAGAPCVPCQIGWRSSRTYRPRMLGWGFGAVLVLVLAGAIVVCPRVSYRRCTLVKLVQAHWHSTEAGVRAILGPPTFRVPDTTRNVLEATLIWQQNGRTVFSCGVDRGGGVTCRSFPDPLPLEALQ
jgi:hypothetical protein